MVGSSKSTEPGVRVPGSDYAQISQCFKVRELERIVTMKENDEKFGSLGDLRSHRGDGELYASCGESGHPEGKSVAHRPPDGGEGRCEIVAPLDAGGAVD